MIDNGQVELSKIAGETGLFVDGDWIESKDQDSNGDVRLIQMMDIGDGKYLNKSSRFLTSETAKRLRCTFLKSGDVLISRMPDPIGRACIFPGDERPCVTAVDVCIARTDPKLVDNNWLKHRINSLGFRAQISRWATGTTRARISRGNLGKISLHLPKLEEQKRLAAILDQADAIRHQRHVAVEIARDAISDFFLDQFGDPFANPNEYDCLPISEVAKIVTGNTPSRKEPENYGDEIEWIKSGNINTPSHYLTQASERLSKIGERKSRPVPSGSTLVTCIAGSPDCIGNAALTDRRVASNQQINAVVPLSLIHI